VALEQRALQRAPVVTGPGIGVRAGPDQLNRDRAVGLEPATAYRCDERGIAERVEHRHGRAVVQQKPGHFRRARGVQRGTGVVAVLVRRRVEVRTATHQLPDERQIAFRRGPEQRRLPETVHGVEASADVDRQCAHLGVPQKVARFQILHRHGWILCTH
jgi:hypothetical protein